MKQIVRLTQQELLELVFEVVAAKVGLDPTDSNLVGDFKFQTSALNGVAKIDYIEVSFRAK